MRFGLLIDLFMLMVMLKPAEAFGDPAGVWIPVKPDKAIERIHISGSPFNYTATIDYHCSMGVCATLQSLVEDNAHFPPTYSVPLEGVGPAPMLALRWQKGPPCNRATSDENPLAYWAATPSGKIGAAVRMWCFIHPPAPHSPASTLHR